MSVTLHKPDLRPVKHAKVPPLQPGDHLTRPEFERRYDATPGLKKAELIEGKVYMPPPVSHDYHSAPHSHLLGWLVLYKIGTPAVLTGDNGSLRLDIDNMPQPDAYLMIEPGRGGQARIDPDGYVSGAPELIGEVAASSASQDLHEKLHVYRRSGVREYVVWRTYDGEIDYFILREGRFDPLAPDSAGIIRSEVFPGLWLNVPALLAGDLPAVAATVQDGINSPEHAAFAVRMRATST